MTMEDVCNTLIQLNMIFIDEASPPPIRPSPGQTIKFPKGRKNGVARKHLQRMQAQDKELDGVKTPFAVPKNYKIQFDRTKVEVYLNNWESKGYLKLKPEKLQWTPYIMTRNPREAGVDVDLPAMDTVADNNSRLPFVNGQCTEPVAEPTSESVQESISEPLPESIAEPVAEPTVITNLAIEEPTPVTPSLDVMRIDVAVPMQIIDNDELPTIVPSTPSRSGSRAESSTSSFMKASLTKSPSPSSPSLPYSSPPVRPARTLRSSRSQTKYASPSMEVDDDEVTPIRLTRGRRSSKKVDVGEDEALATELAKEGRLQGRQLRSGRGVSQLERKRAATPVSISKIVPGRKRRRIESSPETSRESSPEEVNGQHLNGKDLTPVPMIVEPVAAKEHRDYYRGEDECQSEAQTAGDGVKPNGDMVVLKSEDGFSGFGSRESHPSDDTIFMTEVNVHVHMGKSSNGFAGFRGAVHAESDLRSTLGPDELHDEDADGEYDEDAEGEDEESVVGYYCT